MGKKPAKMDELRHLLKMRRLELGLTQYQVAKKIGLGSPAYVNMVESGIRRFDLDRLKAVATTLDLELSLLVQLTVQEVYHGSPWLVEQLSPTYRHAALKLGEIDDGSREQVLKAIDRLHKRSVHERPRKPATN